MNTDCCACTKRYVSRLSVPLSTRACKNRLWVEQNKQTCLCNKGYLKGGGLATIHDVPHGQDHLQLAE